MAVSTVKLNGQTLMTVNDTTATASDVAQTKYFYAADGTKTLGTASGGSSWEFIASKEITTSTTSTSSTLIEWWTATDDDSLWTADKMVYVRIRDKAGKRAGYFYGSDNYFINQYAKNSTAYQSVSTVIRFIIGVNSSGNYVAYNGYGTTGYGVFCQSFECEDNVVGHPECNLRLQQRYSSTYGTVNGTYLVEVYLIPMPTGKPIWV